MTEYTPSKTFVFDIAGVLLEWNPLQLYQNLFAGDEAKLSYFFSDVINDQVQDDISRGIKIDDLLNEAAKKHPDYETPIRAYKERWQEMLIGQIGGTVSALEELRERGYKTYALGNWSREEFNWVINDFSFLQHFDDVLLSGDCGYLKPDPEIYQLAEQQFQLDPINTVFIDDRADNVQAAVQRGWNGIVFENPRHLYLTLMEYKLL